MLLDISDEMAACPAIRRVLGLLNGARPIACLVSLGEPYRAGRAFTTWNTCRIRVEDSMAATVKGRHTYPRARLAGREYFLDAYELKLAHEQGRRANA